jgi:LysR family glycine cleavage system transcriptional activator
VDTTLAAVEIVATGDGVALVQRRLTHGPVKDGRIAVAFDAEVALEKAHYLVSAPGRTVAPEAEAFKAWLRGQFAEGGAG